MIMTHPPYFDIIKYSDKQNDLSNSKEFFGMWREVINNCNKYLDKDRIFAFVCGDLYRNSEFLRLGHKCADIVESFGYICKGHIIKDYGATKAGDRFKRNLYRYRELKGGYWMFGFDNIFIMQKVKK